MSVCLDKIWPGCNIYIVKSKTIKPHFIAVVEARALLRLSVGLTGNRQQVRGGVVTLDIL